LLGGLLERMHAELAAEVESPEAFAELARGWFTGCMDEVFGPLSLRLREDPVTKASVRALDVEGRIEQAGPDQVLGELLTYRKQSGVTPTEVLYSQLAWDRFLNSLSKNPSGLEVSIVPLNGEGFRLYQAWCSIEARWDRLSPGWARFSFSAGAGPLTNWPESRDIQASWAGFVRRQAALMSACAGSMTDDVWPGGDTALQRTTNSVPSNLLLKISQSREVLLGYSWVTVVAAELAARLGGVAAMSASGAFCEVEEMPGGALWLRATPAINDFTGDRVRRVFEALAPVLITGTAKIEHRSEMFRIVEGVDAADYR
jgi:hypothetical protein